MYQLGVWQFEICQKLNLPKSTLCTIIKSKESVLSRIVPSNQTKLYKLFSDLDMQVSKWVLEQAAKRNHLNGVVIAHRAKAIHRAMVAELSLEP